jgi:hypothetical protein
MSIIVEYGLFCQEYESVDNFVHYSFFRLGEKIRKGRDRKVKPDDMNYY